MSKTNSTGFSIAKELFAWGKTGVTVAAEFADTGAKVGGELLSGRSSRSAGLADLMRELQKPERKRGRTR